MSCTLMVSQTWPTDYSEIDDGTLHILEKLYNFKIFYESYHRYLALVLCAAGFFANIVHICVLVQPHMRRSSVHATLTYVAIADIGTMLSYLVYILRFEFFTSAHGGYSYAWVVFLRFHAVASVALHAISLYLVVFMAFIRLTALRIGHSKWMMPKMAYAIGLIISIVLLIICIPTFLAHEIYNNDASANVLNELHRTPKPVLTRRVIDTLLQSLAANEQTFYGVNDTKNHNTTRNISNAYGEYYNFEYNKNSWLKIRKRIVNEMKKHPTHPKLYKVSFSERFLQKNCALLRLNLWFTGIFFKAIPCFLLLWFTFALLKKLRRNEQKRLQLFQTDYTSTSKYSQVRGDLCMSTSAQRLTPSTRNNDGDGDNIGSSYINCNDLQQELVKDTIITNESVNDNPMNIRTDTPSFLITKRPSQITSCGDFVYGINNKINVKVVIKKMQNGRKISRAVDRTTYILLLMLTIFILTELPQGLFAILNALLTNRLHRYVYLSIADVLDLLSLINCHAAFTVYICTSTTYRQTLARLIGSLFVRQINVKLRIMK